MLIHRNTNYIKFIAAINTTACNAGELLEAWKDDCGNWYVYNPKEGRRYQAYISTIRTICGECLEQGSRKLTTDWKLRH